MAMIVRTGMRSSKVTINLWHNTSYDARWRKPHVPLQLPLDLSNESLHLKQRCLLIGGPPLQSPARFVHRTRTSRIITRSKKPPSTYIIPNTLRSITIIGHHLRQYQIQCCSLPSCQTPVFQHCQPVVLIPTSQPWPSHALDP
jgi:hypothetical protein